MTGVLGTSPPPFAPPLPPPPVVEIVAASEGELADALQHARMRAYGLPVRIRLRDGEYSTTSTFDNRTVASEIWIVGDSSTVHAATPMQPVFTLASALLRVHLHHTRILGRLVVEMGELLLVDCRIDHTHTSLPAQRAILIRGGRVLLSKTTIQGHMAGAISVHAARLLLEESIVEECHADMGGGMLVTGGAVVTVISSRIANNAARISGGAIHVNGGHVALLNETLLEDNSARHSGGSIFLSTNSTLGYTLPVPSGRWLNIRQGINFQLEKPAVDSDFPYACPAGVVGGTSAEDQSWPGCGGPCPAGRLCPPATVWPQPCPRGSYCPSGSPVPLPCSAGTFSSLDHLTSESECDVWCSD
eukprot:2203483-Prymnesium_polylepis.1